jgi:hypothetical protein
MEGCELHVKVSDNVGSCKEIYKDLKSRKAHINDHGKAACFNLGMKKESSLREIPSVRYKEGHVAGVPRTKGHEVRSHVLRAFRN